MKITGYLTDVGVRESRKGKSYPYVEVEGLRLSVGDGLFDLIASLPKGREYTFVCKHRLFPVGDAWRTDIQLVAVEGECGPWLRNS